MQFTIKWLRLCRVPSKRVLLLTLPLNPLPKPALCCGLLVSGVKRLLSHARLCLWYLSAEFTQGTINNSGVLSPAHSLLGAPDCFNRQQAHIVVGMAPVEAVSRPITRQQQRGSALRHLVC
jgi:hypothetical protein